MESNIISQTTMGSGGTNYYASTDNGLKSISISDYVRACNIKKCLPDIKSIKWVGENKFEISIK